jgi:hypothetical protein
MSGSITHRPVIAEFPEFIAADHACAGQLVTILEDRSLAVMRWAGASCLDAEGGKTQFL